ncbi:MAG: hypothetical protein V3U88_09500, partial [Methylococcales bacterium]
MKTNRLVLSQVIAALLLTSVSIPVLSEDGNSRATSRQKVSPRRTILRQVLDEAPEGDRRQIRRDVFTVLRRGDVRNLPLPLYKRMLELAARPHTYLPQTAFAEADGASQLVQHYLIDTTEFQPNIFTSQIAGINDRALQTGANFANDGLPTIGAIRVLLEPKEGLPTDPDDPRAFLDMFTDISGLFVINNESGWYEGWMIRDITIPDIAEPRNDGTGQAQYGTITQ